MIKDDSGYIVVETVGTFIPFVMLIISILSLVNIITLQARIHYALTQAANTLSMYSYTLEVLGIANELTTLDEKAYKAAKEANEMRADIDAVLSGINAFSDLRSAAEGAESAVSRVYSLGEELITDPKETLQLLMNYGLNEIRNQVFEEMVRPIIGRYLANGEKTGDEYLRGVRVVRTDGSGNICAEGLAALQFHDWSALGLGNSVMIDRNGNVVLTVRYEVEYTFGGLKLPFRPTLKITQTVVTKAWLNGSGKGYW